MGDTRFEPIVLRYDGLDAANHQIDLAQLGFSLQGASKLIGIAANYALTGVYVKKTPALSVRILAGETRGRCYEIVAIIAVLYPVVQPVLPLVKELGSKAVEAIVNSVIAKFSGRPQDMEKALNVVEAAVQEQGATSRLAIDAMRDVVSTMAEANRPAVKLFSSPVGESCATAQLGKPENGAIQIDRAMKDAIYSPAPIQITDERRVRVFLSEVDMQARSCKLSVEGDDDPDRRYPGIITDPVIGQPHNPYVDALAAQRWLEVKAKAEMREGDLEKFYISDTAA